MKGTEFNVAGVWPRRNESPEMLGRTFLEALDALSRIDPHFESWNILDDENETSYPLEQVRSRIGEIVERGVSRDEGIPVPEEGYSICAYNRPVESDANRFSVKFSVHDGGIVGGTGGGGFRTAYGVIPDPSIVRFPVIKSVLTTIVGIWKMRNASARSSELAEYWDMPAYNFDLSWITYLSQPLAMQIAPPPDIDVERMGDGGLLLIATRETFDTQNPDHMAAAYRIRDVLAPLNDVEQHKKVVEETEQRSRILEGMGFQRVSRRPRKD